MKSIINLLFKPGIGISKEQYLFGYSLYVIINIVFFLFFLMFLEVGNLTLATLVLVFMIIVPAGYISSNLRIKRLHDLGYAKNTFNFWFRFFGLTSNSIFFWNDGKKKRNIYGEQKNNINIPVFMRILIASVFIVLLYILIIRIINDVSILSNYFLLIKRIIHI